MSKECEQLHEILKRGKVFDFKAGINFNAYLDNFFNFPENGVYFMFEKGEVGHKGVRVVRIGINRERTMAYRLNMHINGAAGNSIFRKHLSRILGTEERVSEHILKEIKFCAINDPDNRRKEIEKKSIGEVSRCKICKSSSQWLGLKSENIKINESGLWNVQHVFREHRLSNNDIKYINDNLVIAKNI